MTAPTLAQALEPFAKFAAKMPSIIPDDHFMTNGSPLAMRQVTVGDFRRAAEALAAHRSQAGGEREAIAPDAILIGLRERVGEALENGDGFWRECSGCYETEDGQNVHGYPKSAALRCVLGGGCGECGGLGAIWDAVDYEAAIPALRSPSPISGEVAALREAIQRARGILLYPTGDMLDDHGFATTGILAAADALLEVEGGIIKPTPPSSPAPSVAGSGGLADGEG